jgi:polyvinyl alcohol dehydrogenase (cytochrome)
MRRTPLTVVIGVACLAVTAGTTAAWAAAPAAPATPAAPAAPRAPQAAKQAVVNWPFAGGNLNDTRDAAAEHIIGLSTVSTLKPRWTLTTGGNVSATPTVVNGTVYVPDWGGNLWAVSAATGKVVWKNPVSRYSRIAGDISRTSPAYWNGLLVTGEGVQTIPTRLGAYMLGINAGTGSPLWRTRVDSDPTAIITSSAVISNGVAYVGVSSKAQAVGGLVTFRGSVVALNARTGKVLWKRYTVPTGYTGGAVWGSTPVVDNSRGLLYVDTGNNESVPPGVCNSPTQTGCAPVSPADYIDSILALSLRTGRIVWARRTLTSDTSSKTHHYGPDYDFGAGPNLYQTTLHGKPVQLLGAGQKSGLYWALNPATGKVVWKTEAGPGGMGGGIMWGTATDGRRVYVSIGNTNHVKYTIVSASGKKSTTTGGFWAALDAATGKILWQTADPQLAKDTDAVTVGNGVVYVGSMAAAGDTMYALDAATGLIKWRFDSGGAVTSGAAVVNGTAYWGSGYDAARNDKLYAFAPAGR